MSNTGPMASRTGRVLSVLGPGRYLVEIQIQSACAACHARSACHAFDWSAREVEAAGTQILKVGDTVVVTLEERLGLEAVLWGLVIPIILVLGGVLGLRLGLGCSEPLAALGGLAAGGGYAGVLWRLRGRLKRRLHLDVRLPEPDELEENPMMRCER